LSLKEASCWSDARRTVFGPPNLLTRGNLPDAFTVDSCVEFGISELSCGNQKNEELLGISELSCEYTTEKDGPDHNPRFTATVTVNGMSFELPKDQWRSSKEAQNHAAHIAYDHFIVPQSIPLLTPQPSLLPTSSDRRIDYNTAQKQNLTLPVYSSELDGRPHTCCFRSKVTVDTLRALILECKKLKVEFGIPNYIQDH
ncbi:hypothetical protein H5410_033218, partial [Solanum commersonii]